MTQRGRGCLCAWVGSANSHPSPVAQSAVTWAGSPCPLWLPRPQSHSFQIPKKSRREVLGERRCAATNVSTGIIHPQESVRLKNGTRGKEAESSRPGCPSIPSHKLFAPPPPDTGRKRGRRGGRPDAGDNGLAEIQWQWRPMFSLAPKKAWRGGAGRAGRGRGCHAHKAQCCRFKKSLEP